MDQGILQTDNRSIRIKTLDILQKGKMLQRSWPSASGIHAVANDLAQEIYIMDSTLYESMMIQMLIKDPDQYQRYFELVIDNFPWARVYRVQ
jgi:dolichyl-diphosphooligosaccharide--protein glycosyltransferase